MISRGVEQSGQLESLINFRSQVQILPPQFRKVRPMLGFSKRSRKVRTKTDVLDGVLILITVAFAVGRLFITPRLNLPTAEGCYEALVHVFVGALIGGWAVTFAIDIDRLRPFESRHLWLNLAVILTLFEIIVFVIQKHRIPGV